MLLRTVDKLLDRFFKREASFSRLDRLEEDVWERINLRDDSYQASFFLLPIWENARFRYVSLAIALVIGLIASQLSTISVHPDSMGLEVFSTNAPYMLTSSILNAI
mgnify:FL=1